MFSDADDVWLPDKIEKTLARMRRLEQEHGTDKPLLVHTDLRVVDRDLNTLCDSFWKYQFIDAAKGASLNRLLVQNCVTGCTTMLNPRLVELARPVPTQPGQVVMHDWWIALVAAAFGAIGAVDEPTILYRQHGRNDTGAKRWSARHLLGKILRIFQTQELHEALGRAQRQAATFWERFHDRMEPGMADMVAQFAHLAQQGALSRRCTIVRHGFYRVGFARNISLLLRG